MAGKKKQKKAEQVEKPADQTEKSEVANSDYANHPKFAKFKNIKEQN